MPGILDFLQSASNTAASNVSAPVDLVAWLLGKAGVPIKEPVGGSDWMRRQGLMRDVPQSVASLAGEAAGLIGPMALAAKAPQVAKGLLSLQVEGAPNAGRIPMGAQRGAIVYHGSPHKFDKFDSSKIGTGEGAQAYGHGLYVADSKNVAKYYAPADMPSSVREIEAQLNSLGIKPSNNVTSNFGTASFGLKNGMPESAVLSDIRKRAPEFVSVADDDLLAALKGYYRQGNLYKVDLPDSAIARMLDWDKPLSQQVSVIQEAMKHKPPVYTEYTAEELLNAVMTGKDLPSRQLVQQEKISPLSQALGSFREKNISTKPPTGEQIYRALADQYGHDKAASLMRQAGIPGIRYLDGGSRGAGQGTSNYVVFPGEENILKILERNGIPLP